MGRVEFYRACLCSEAARGKQAGRKELRGQCDALEIPLKRLMLLISRRVVQLGNPLRDGALRPATGFRLVASGDANLKFAVGFDVQGRAFPYSVSKRLHA